MLDGMLDGMLDATLDDMPNGMLDEAYGSDNHFTCPN